MNTWWTEADAATVAAWQAWLAAPFDGSRGPTVCCRLCHWWRSADGYAGRCGIPETPATVNCGVTEPYDLCEQWAPREMPAAQGELPL